MSSPVIPALRYRNAAKAVEWLCDAFGFTARMVVAGEGDVVEHAELTYGTGMVMLGSVRKGDYDDLVTTADIAGKPTSSIYIVVKDVAAHAEQARRAGADIVTEPTSQDYGGSNYIARDLEGNLWSFGDYDPWSVDPG